MTTYYVGPGGNDGLAGTSYANRWLTLAKVLGASGIASGDTVYVTPGTYRETVTVAMTSAVAETKIIGDVDGSHTSGTPGDVIWTGYTTNDTTAPSASATLVLAGRDFLTFSNIIFIAGGSTATITAATVTSTNITFTDCTIMSWATGAVTLTIGFGVNAAWLFNRCRIICRGACVVATFTRGTGSDYDTGMVYRNCFMFSILNLAIFHSNTGAGTNFGGGGLIENCTLFSGNNSGVATATSISTTIPCVVQNSIIFASTALAATTSGQITESHNLLSATTARSNVTAGTGSISDGSYSINVEIGQEKANGRQVSPFFTPMAGSPLLGFGAASSPPTVDALNRPRPAGGQTTNAVGHLERHNTATKETGTTDAGSVAVTITGPGDHDFQIPVDAVSTTITVKVNYDTNHGTTNPPQAQLLANNEIGYAGDIQTASASTGTWLTLTFGAFTPTAKSIVTLRLISRAAAANGVAHFDTVTVT